MRPLLPTLKERKRYLLFEIQTALSFKNPAELQQQLEQRLGLFGSAEAGLQMISYDQKTRQGVLRTSLEAAPKVRVALMLITELGGKPARVRVLGSSGILNKTGRFDKIEKHSSEV